MAASFRFGDFVNMSTGTHPNRGNKRPPQNPCGTDVTRYFDCSLALRTSAQSHSTSLVVSWEFHTTVCHMECDGIDTRSRANSKTIS